MCRSVYGKCRGRPTITLADNCAFRSPLAMPATVPRATYRNDIFRSERATCTIAPGFSSNETNRVGPRL